ncbi:concanavalin A-like lectin/glucanase [Sarocladium strictum]
MSRSILLAIATAWTARAQVFADCMPDRQDCPPNPAIGRTTTCDFRQGKCDLFDVYQSKQILYDEKYGAQFVIRNYSDAPTLLSNEYLFFGIIELEMKASPGTGVATMFAVQSDVLDEIDIEMVGGRDEEVQSNYFAKGSVDEENRDGRHAAANVTGTFHNYTVKWTSRSISWSIDGREFRVEGRNPHDVGDTYPQTPARIKLGTWVAGVPTYPEETLEWAGGETNLNEAPFIAQVKRITITDFAGGDDVPQKRVKDYKYATRNGTWQSINVVQTDEENEMRIVYENNTLGEDGTTTTPGFTLGSTVVMAEEDEDGRDDGTLSKGEVAGVVVGCVVGVMLIIAAIFIFWRRTQRQLAMAQESAETDASALSGETKTDIDESISPISELHGRHWEGWRDGKDPPREVYGDVPPAEMNGESMPGELGTEREPVELDSAQVIRGL